MKPSDIKTFKLEVSYTRKRDKPPHVETQTVFASSLRRAIEMTLARFPAGATVRLKKRRPI